MRNGRCSPREPLERLIGDGVASSSQGYATPKASDGEKGGPNQKQKGTEALPKTACKWATPRARDWKGADPARVENRSGKRHAGDCLPTTAVKWATPQSRDGKGAKVTDEVWNKRARPLNEQVERKWPTPTVGDSKASGAKGYSMESGRHSGTTLTDAVTGPRGLLPLIPDHHGLPVGTKPRADWSGASGCDARPALNPRFHEALMGWPIGLTDFASRATGWSQWWEQWRSYLCWLGFTPAEITAERDTLG